jgi:hypothetical protein
MWLWSINTCSIRKMSRRGNLYTNESNQWNTVTFANMISPQPYKGDKMPYYANAERNAKLLLEYESCTGDTKAVYAKKRRLDILKGQPTILKKFIEGEIGIAQASKMASHSRGLERHCKKCGNTLSGKQTEFCSKECRSSYLIRLVCSVCGRTFYRKRSWTNNHEYTKFCSIPCQYGTAAIKNLQNNGKKYPYVYVYVSGHPRNFKGRRGICKRIPLHVIVAEKALARYLNPTEIVHHINYITDDNRPENLAVCKGNSEHCSIHGLTRHSIIEFIKERGLGNELLDFIKTTNPGIVSVADIEKRRNNGHSEVS